MDPTYQSQSLTQSSLAASPRPGLSLPRFLLLLTVLASTLIAWKAIGSRAEVSRAKIQADAQVAMSKETTRQLELMLEARMAGTMAVPMTPPPAMPTPPMLPQSYVPPGSKLL
ncbi:hypothetical protein [Achromobacter anxifer]|uniref:hypothetical protein n=1 Tax=Achromobacter anxifer TaxID=1287737 RepID=UPI001590CE9E|nr:hypothetical protein [Achromobacter anxifer]